MVQFSPGTGGACVLLEQIPGDNEVRSQTFGGTQLKCKRISFESNGKRGREKECGVGSISRENIPGTIEGTCGTGQGENGGLGSSGHQQWAPGDAEKTSVSE